MHHALPCVAPQPLTRLGHALAHGDRVFPLPLLQFLLHLVDFSRIEGPQAALARGASRFVLYLLKTFVEREIVADRILPAIGCRLPEQSRTRSGAGSSSQSQVWAPENSFALWAPDCHPFQGLSSSSAPSLRLAPFRGGAGVGRNLGRKLFSPKICLHPHRWPTLLRTVEVIRTGRARSLSGAGPSPPTRVSRPVLRALCQKQTHNTQVSPRKLGDDPFPGGCLIPAWANPEVVFGCVPVSHICCVYSWVLERERGVCVCVRSWGGLVMSLCVLVPLNMSPWCEPVSGVWACEFL